MREIDVHQLEAARADGAEIVDVREPDEYRAGHIPGARLVPMSQFGARVHEIPRDRRVFVVCASGNRSSAMADLLRAQGVDAVNVAGGTQGWMSAGLPVVEGPHAA